jgi:hypothetical protein
MQLIRAIINYIAYATNSGKCSSGIEKAVADPVVTTNIMPSNHDQ